MFEETLVNHWTHKENLTRRTLLFRSEQPTHRPTWPPPTEQFISSVKFTCSLSAAYHFDDDASLIPLPSQHAPVSCVLYGPPPFGVLISASFCPGAVTAPGPEL